MSVSSLRYIKIGSPRKYSLGLGRNCLVSTHHRACHQRHQQLKHRSSTLIILTTVSPRHVRDMADVVFRVFQSPTMRLSTENSDMSSHKIIRTVMSRLQDPAPVATCQLPGTCMQLANPGPGRVMPKTPQSRLDVKVYEVLSSLGYHHNDRDDFAPGPSH